MLWLIMVKVPEIVKPPFSPTLTAPSFSSFIRISSMLDLNKEIHQTFIQVTHDMNLARKTDLSKPRQMGR
jgi:ABC-type lipoprotein export system ATPase subunit